MLKLSIPPGELYDEANEKFIQIKGCTIQIEHSLVSIQKWEAKWNKPFMSSEEKTIEEIQDYIRCMTLTQNVDPNVYLGITKDILDKVYSYINAPMTATTFPKRNGSELSREVLTSEVIYSQMILLGIPSEYRKWHLNQLLTLIQVCAIKSQSPKPMSRREIMKQNRALNEARKRKHHTRG